MDSTKKAPKSKPAVQTATVVTPDGKASIGTLISLNNGGFVQLQNPDNSMVYFSIPWAARVDVTP